MAAEPEGRSGPLVVAVVLTWNDTTLAGRCIESLQANDYAPLDICVVDNGSKEPCGEQLRKRFPEIEALVLPSNLGFTGGCNRGLEYALGRGAKYVFLLNNDTLVERSAVRLLVEALEARPEAGAASALLLFPGEERRVQFYTGEIHRDSAQHVHIAEHTPLASRSWPTVQTDFAPACALMFRAEALRRVGLFDESLGTCWEDYDLSVRFLDAGSPYVTVGDAHVVHDHGVTTGRRSPYITYYFARNRLICLARYGRPLGVLRRAPHILRSFYWQVKAYGLSSWACHAAFVRAWVDFLAGVRGEVRGNRSRAEAQRRR